MSDKIKPSEAMSRAEGAFKKWYNDEDIADKIEAFENDGKWTIKVKNDGTKDFVASHLEPDIGPTWKAKGELGGFGRRYSFSSGEAKIDLKFAYPGQKDSSFNYHVWVKIDPAIIEAEKEKEKEAAAAKKAAAEFKKKQEKEKEEKEAAAKVQAEKDKVEAARQNKLQLGANAAWNKLGKDGQKGKKEDDWKKQWKQKNDKSYK